MKVITYAYAASSNAIRDHVEAFRSRERGQGTLEYLGLLVLVAGIIFVLVQNTNIGQIIKTAVMDAIKTVTNLDPTGGGSNSGGNNGGGNP